MRNSSIQDRCATLSPASLRRPPASTQVSWISSRKVDRSASRQPYTCKRPALPRYVFGTSRVVSSPGIVFGVVTAQKPCLSSANVQHTIQFEFFAGPLKDLTVATVYTSLQPSVQCSRAPVAYSTSFSTAQLVSFSENAAFMVKRQIFIQSVPSCPG